MSTKAIPSFGALTPVESIIKGASPSDVFNPANIMGDTMMAIQKPSSLLINPLKDSGSTMTNKQQVADESAARDKARENNKWLNWTQDISKSSTTNKTGLSV